MPDDVYRHCVLTQPADTPYLDGMTTATKSAGQQLDEIMRDMDAAYAAIKSAGYPWEGPEQDALEAVYVRLRAWNAARV